MGFHAKFHVLEAIGPDIESGVVRVYAKDAQGLRFLIEIPSQLVPNLLLGLMHSGPKLGNPDAKMQPLTLDSTQAFTLPDGRAGLELVVDRVVRLPLIFPPEAIPLLRTALDSRP